MSDLYPGSPEAVTAGCTCPILDNARGAGVSGSDPETGTAWTCWWKNSTCPLHGLEVAP